MFQKINRSFKLTNFKWKKHQFHTRTKFKQISMKEYNWFSEKTRATRSFAPCSGKNELEWRIQNKSKI